MLNVFKISLNLKNYFSQLMTSHHQTSEFTYYNQVTSLIIASQFVIIFLNFDTHISHYM